MKLSDIPESVVDDIALNSDPVIVQRRDGTLSLGLISHRAYGLGVGLGRFVYDGNDELLHTFMEGAHFKCFTYEEAAAEHTNILTQASKLSDFIHKLKAALNHPQKEDEEIIEKFVPTKKSKYPTSHFSRYRPRTGLDHI